MAFATVADMLASFDARRVAQLVNDTDAQLLPSDLTTTGTDANTRILTALNHAAEEIVAAAVVGNRYTRDQLSALVATAGSTTPSGYLLVRLNVDLAFGLLVRRRAWPAKDSDDNAPSFEWAEGYLQLLRTGERVFIDAPGQDEAGLPGTQSELPSVTAVGANGMCVSPLLSQNVNFFGTTVNGGRNGYGWGRCGWNGC